MEQITATAADMPRLTRREIEVLQLMSTGIRSKDAADRLFVTKRTIDFHLQSIYDKLGVRKLQKALIIATKAGVIQ